MARRRRQLNVFSLSFLDVMAGGLGAVILVFMIINHSGKVRSAEVNREILAEVNRLEVRVLSGEKNRVRIKNTLEEVEQEQVITEGRSKEILKQIEQKKIELAELEQDTTASQEHINKLKADLKAVEEETRRLEGSRDSQQEQGDATRTFIGKGDRQYLTGLKVGGERILILVDASASMLDETIVNVIRRRNLSDARKKQAQKWQRVVSTVDWITTQVPIRSRFQIYTFNTQVKPLLEGTRGKWLDTESGGQLNQAIDRLRQIVPTDGTSLYQAFTAVNSLSPRPDTIYLLTDGLPTQGKSKPFRSKASPDARLKNFDAALQALPKRIPVNIILFPMEGDPRASSAYWQLAQVTGGSLLSPSRDWP